MIQINENNNIFEIIITEPREDRDEEQFLNLLARLSDEMNFGLILEVSGEKAFSKESKIQLNKWFKLNKEHLRNQCLGFIRVKADAKNSDKLKSRAFSLAMPCPYRVMETREQASLWFTTGQK
ncbi:hypothetical protein [Bacteriovorax sp. DB6_IX]|uniref:hypothetical protein n=1 Tax=Bacteriovorax sp. DB6_IX TaxID=1353530 RepID=UPI000389FE08|nr:hypothetical protein [Bacteriovorax sp. DB6_IX]EQC50808.1 hypothetical protein M901_0593 [Bacteriovorax sp. DB6_IX]